MINRPVKPAIVLIPGSFSIAAMYYPLQEELQAAGHETYINLLPSASRNPPETPESLEDDAKAFTKTIRPLVDQGKHVVVLGHSYGGMVASQLPLDLSEEYRRANGQQGGIVRLIYLAAIVLPVGQSVVGDQGMPPDSIVRIDKVCLSGQPTDHNGLNIWIATVRLHATLQPISNRPAHV